MIVRIKYVTDSEAIILLFISPDGYFLRCGVTVRTASREVCGQIQFISEAGARGLARGKAARDEGNRTFRESLATFAFDGELIRCLAGKVTWRYNE